jgi:hypothetical protein
MSADRKKAFLAQFDHRVVRLENELEKFVKLVALQLEALTNEASEGLSPSSPAVSSEVVLRKLKDLGATFNSATDAKVRLAKAAELIEKTMTPAQELDAMRRILRAMPQQSRADWLREEIAWHNADPARSGVPMSKAPA